MVGFDSTCKGVLLGSTTAVVVVGFASAVAVGAAHIVLARRRLGDHTEKVASVANACAMVRAPHVWLMVCLYLTNSFAVCGMEVARGDHSFATRAAGAVAFAFPLVLAVSFPIITLMLGTRRLMPVRYRWEPRAVRMMGGIVFQSWAHDPSLNAHQLFGPVMGANRRLGCLWTLVPHSSFLAGLPMMLASDRSCVPLFAVSSALFFALAVLVLAARPRRVPASDVLHSVTLAMNGAIVAISTSLLRHSDSDSSDFIAALERLGQAVTVLTVVRSMHSLGGLSLALLLRRDFVSGVEVELQDGVLEYVGLCCPLEKVHTDLRMPLVSDVGEGREMVLSTLVDQTVPLEVGNDNLGIVDTTSIPYINGGSTSSLNISHIYDEGEYLTEEQRFRREIARDCVRRQLEEFLTLNV